MMSHGSSISNSGHQTTDLEPTTLSHSDRFIPSGRGGGRGGYPRDRPGVIGWPNQHNYQTTPLTSPNEDATPVSSFNVPPTAAVLQGKRTSEAFFVNARNSTASREIKLTVEFPTHIQQDHTNDIAMYFKLFTTFLLSAHRSIVILNWKNPLQNPITKAIDISQSECRVGDK